MIGNVLMDHMIVVLNKIDLLPEEKREAMTKKVRVLSRPLYDLVHCASYTEHSVARPHFVTPLHCDELSSPV